MKSMLAKTGLALLLAVLVPACGGGSNGRDSVAVAPFISNFLLSPEWVYRNAGGGVYDLLLEVDFRDPNGDIVSVTVTIVDKSGATLTGTDPLEDMNGATAGTIYGLLEVDTTSVKDYVFHVSVTDAQGLQSNELTAPFRIGEQPWIPKTPMPTPRTGFGVAEAGGKIYVLGGALAGSGALSDLVEVYDPGTDRWSTGVPLPTPGGGYATSVNGKIYLTSGSSNLEFDPVTEVWSTKSSTSLPGLAGVAVLDGKVLVLGGRGFGDPDDSSSVEVYNVSADDWSAGVPLPTARQQLRGASLAGKAYAIGGYEDTAHVSPYLQEIDEFDPGTGLWTPKAPMSVARARFGCTVAAGQIFSIGGENFWYQDSVEAFDPSDGAWHSKTPLPTPLSNIEAQSASGKIYVFQTSLTLEYTPENDLIGVQVSATAGPSAPLSTAPPAVSKPVRWSTVRW